MAKNWQNLTYDGSFFLKLLTSSICNAANNKNKTSGTKNQNLVFSRAAMQIMRCINNNITFAIATSL